MTKIIQLFFIYNIWWEYNITSLLQENIKNIKKHTENRETWPSQIGISETDFPVYHFKREHWIMSASERAWAGVTVKMLSIFGLSTVHSKLGVKWPLFHIPPFSQVSKT